MAAPATIGQAPGPARPLLSGAVAGRAGLHILPLLAAPPLAASALMAPDARVLAALGFIIVLGVPHGALDGEVARDLLRPRFGRGWFLVFAPPYLALSALVLAGWHLVPIITLALFLAVSVVHFGCEEAATPSWVERLARGGLPVALPSLFHPAATAALFATVTAVPLPALPPWWLWAALAWVLPFTAWAGGLLRRGEAMALAPSALLGLGFLVLPPLTAFALYFICVHAPAHVAGLIADPRRARRVTNAATAWGRALPLFGLTLLLGLALWPFYEGAAAARLLALTLQGLAALTLPHMLLEAAAPRLQHALTRRPRPVPSPRSV